MHSIEVILFLLAAGYPVSSELVYPCAGFIPSLRPDCGYYGIQKEECLRRLCCWDDTIQNVPWCFKNREECGPPGQGLTEEHTDCGWVGIDRDTCNKRGCCYIKNQACFYPKSHKCHGINPFKREECGYFGIQREECENKGCCFDHTHHSVPWCFKGRSMSLMEGSGAPPTTEEAPFA